MEEIAQHAAMIVMEIEEKRKKNEQHRHQQTADHYYYEHYVVKTTNGQKKTTLLMINHNVTTRAEVEEKGGAQGKSFHNQLPRGNFPGETSQGCYKVSQAVVGNITCRSDYSRNFTNLIHQHQYIPGKTS